MRAIAICIAVLFLGLVVACGSSGDSGNSAGPAQQAATSQPTPPPIPWDKSLIAGNAEVKISRVTYRKPILVTKEGAPTEGSSVVLCIELRTTNTSPTLRIEVKPWEGSMFGLGKSTLVDEHGNEYKQIAYRGAWPVGMATKDEMVYPGKSHPDMLLFEVPVPQAKHLDLSLPMSRVGGNGIGVFRIPTSGIGRQ